MSYDGQMEMDRELVVELRVLFFMINANVIGCEQITRRCLDLHVMPSLYGMTCTMNFLHSGEKYPAPSSRKTN